MYAFNFWHKPAATYVLLVFLENFVDKNVSVMPVIVMSHTAVPPQKVQNVALK